MVQLKELGLVCDRASLCCVSFYPRVNNVLMYGLGFSSNKVLASRGALDFTMLPSLKIN